MVKIDAVVSAPFFPKSDDDVLSEGFSANIFLEVGAAVDKGTSFASLDAGTDIEGVFGISLIERAY